MEEVARLVARHFGEEFGTQIALLDTLEELTGNANDVPMRPPNELRKLHKEEETFWA